MFIFITTPSKISDLAAIIMRETGLHIQPGVLLAALVSFGGMAGSVIVGRLIDRSSAVTVLIGAYLAAAAAVAGYGLGAGLSAALYAITLLAGALIIGAQSGVTAMAASFYPTSMRSTRLGWALAVGRVVSIVGPGLGGVMLSAHWSVETIFMAAAVPTIGAAAAIFAIHIFSPSWRQALRDTTKLVSHVVH
jgi:AAHS family 4-hydroxybenzoate transporter-like MFS transporter